MKKSQFTAWPKLCTALFLSAAAVFMVSCAKDGFDDETFQSHVKNQPLKSPELKDISITPTVDKSQTVISWKVQEGAGSYECKVLNVTDVTPVVVLDSIIDGTSFVIPREEDSNYKFSIRTLATDILGNNKLGNKDAETPTDTTFTSFVEPFGTITESDLYAYFQPYFMPAEGEESLLPEEAPEELYFDLKAGENYVISGPVDFGGHTVILRCTDKNNRPTVKVTGSISTSAPMTLQNIIFDYSQIPDDAKTPAAIYLSSTPDESIKGKVQHTTSTTDYYNICDGAIRVTNCDMKGLKGMFLYDNNNSNIKYCVETLLIENCRIQFATPADLANYAYIYLPQGFVKDLTIKNSTMWNTGAGKLQYFIRYNNSGRIDRAGYDKASETQSITHSNSTFYNLASGWWANYNGLVGQAYTLFDIKENIFVECGLGGSGIARRLLGGRTAETYSKKCEFYKNTYWTNGKAETEGAPDNVEGATETYDKSKSALQSDPELRDPANGDLTPQGSEQVANLTGDPYWFNN